MKIMLDDNNTDPRVAEILQQAQQEIDGHNQQKAELVAQQAELAKTDEQKRLEQESAHAEAVKQAKATFKKQRKPLSDELSTIVGAIEVWRTETLQAIETLLAAVDEQSAHYNSLDRLHRQIIKLYNDNRLAFESSSERQADIAKLLTQLDGIDLSDPDPSNRLHYVRFTNQNTIVGDIKRTVTNEVE